MTEITVGSYKYHIFKNTGTIKFQTGRTFEYLIIAGGGGGGSVGGGGGAGEVVSGSVTVTTETTYTCTVGLGGTAGNKGQNSSISTIPITTANGGGNGAGYNFTTGKPGSTGGSGGGGVTPFINLQAGYASEKSLEGLGNNGGRAVGPGGGGGGGGSGGVGQDSQQTGVDSAFGGIGGKGTSNFSMWINAIAPFFDANWRAKTIFGGIGYIASGGSGASFNNIVIPTPTGGGGNGGGSNIEAESGTSNTGGGGGGSRSIFGSSGAGGSGLIVIRYYLDKGNMNALSLYLSGSLNGVSVVNPNPTYNVPAATSTLSNPSVSLYATNVIASGVGFALNSDERIKKNIQYLSSNDSFELIKALKPASFQYVDLLKGTVPKYGYLAQEVESVLPYIVNKNTGYIPNFFEMVRIEKNKNKIILQEKKTETLAIGTKLQFYDLENVPLFRQVVEILDEKTFIVNESFLSESETFFLYGQEVEDYRSIDTDQMNTVLLSALQETQKIMENQDKQLDDLEKII